MRNRVLSALAVLLALCNASVRAEAPAGGPREQFLKLLDRPRVDAAPQFKDMEAPEGLKQLHLVIRTEKDQQMPAYLVKRAGDEGKKLPVVIMLHGTSSNKDSNLASIRALAKMGFLGVAPDGRYHGERCAKGKGTDDYFPAIVQAYRDGKSHPWLYDTVYDVMRLIDYLQTRDDVDASRIGLMGFSKGGMETWLAAAADTRVAVAIPCIGSQSFKWALENDKWQGRVGSVGGEFEAVLKEEGLEKGDAAFAKKFYDRLIPGIYDRFDGPVMLAAIAPRPLMAINGDNDKFTPVGSVKLTAAAAQKAYEAAGVPDRFRQIIQENTEHKVTNEARKEAYDWLVKWLKP